MLCFAGVGPIGGSAITGDPAWRGLVAYLRQYGTHELRKGLHLDGVRIADLSEIPQPLRPNPSNERAWRKDRIAGSVWYMDVELAEGYVGRGPVAGYKALSAPATATPQ